MQQGRTGSTLAPVDAPGSSVSSGAPVLVVLRLGVDGDGRPAGSIEPEHQPARPFVGWLELTSTLSGYLPDLADNVFPPTVVEFPG